MNQFEIDVVIRAMEKLAALDVVEKVAGGTSHKIRKFIHDVKNSPFKNNLYESPAIRKDLESLARSHQRALNSKDKMFSDLAFGRTPSITDPKQQEFIMRNAGQVEYMPRRYGAAPADILTTFDVVPAQRAPELLKLLKENKAWYHS